jgi:hypothetical protein
MSGLESWATTLGAVAVPVVVSTWAVQWVLGRRLDQVGRRLDDMGPRLDGLHQDLAPPVHE